MSTSILSYIAVTGIGSPYMNGQVGLTKLNDSCDSRHAVGSISVHSVTLRATCLLNGSAVVIDGSNGDCSITRSRHPTTHSLDKVANTLTSDVHMVRQKLTMPTVVKVKSVQSNKL